MQSEILMLRTIARPDKQISLPPVVVVESFHMGGMYCAPTNREILLEGRYHSLVEGLILLVAVPGGDLDANLAHEYRHHWQWMNGWKFDGVEYSDSKQSYKRNVIRYFMGSRSEMDAHLFSLPYIRKDYPLQWQEWLIKERERLSLGRRAANITAQAEAYLRGKK